VHKGEKAVERENRRGSTGDQLMEGLVTLDDWERKVLILNRSLCGSVGGRRRYSGVGHLRKENEW
jgi:hypothetical protein